MVWSRDRAGGGLVRGWAVRGAALSLLAVAGAARADWTVTVLHPAGATESSANGVAVHEGVLQQAGGAVFGGASHAALWTGSAASFVDLHPAGDYTASAAYGIGGGQQVGVAAVVIPSFGTFQFAALWTGTATSYVSIAPSGGNSVAFGVAGGQQVGSLTEHAYPNDESGCVWSGTPSQTTFNADEVRATDGTQQVGNSGGCSFFSCYGEAYLWTGTIESRVTLNPAGAYTAGATGVHGGQQVGWVKMGSLFDPVHAAMWMGTAASHVDLHPSGANDSQATAVHWGVQVGSAKVLDPDIDPNNALDRASLWTGNAASWTDLHEALPAGEYYSSKAQGVWSDLSGTYVVGSGVRMGSGETVALMWTWQNAPTCDSIDFNNDGVFPDTTDIFTMLAVFAGAECPECNDIDFNNDEVFPDITDLELFLLVMSGGSC